MIKPASAGTAITLNQPPASVGTSITHPLPASDGTAITLNHNQPLQVMALPPP